MFIRSINNKKINSLKYIMSNKLYYNYFMKYIKSTAFIFELKQKKIYSKTAFA